jgi:hypothetical protein
MTTTRKAVDAIARHIGLDQKRVRAVAITLTAAHIIPSGAPRTPPQLDPEHVVSLVIGICIDVHLRAVAETVIAYRELGLPGHDASGMPASVAAKFYSAGDYLDVLADMAAFGTLDAQSDVSKMKIEIATSERAIAILHSDSDAQRFQPAGTLAGHWQASGHRASVLINGSAFVSVLRELFAKD